MGKETPEKESIHNVDMIYTLKMEKREEFVN